MHNELTENDIKKMQEEIHALNNEVIPDLLVQLKAARDLGDLSENDEYHSIKRELGKRRGRVRYLQNMIDTATVISVGNHQNAIDLFDRVTIYDEDDEEERDITIATTVRNDPLNGIISNAAPLGKALLGKKVGDRVEIRVKPDYSYFVVVRKIEKGHDDSALPINSY